MKTLIPLLAVVFLLIGCESEADKASREDLSTYIRRVNLLYKTMDDARTNEETLTRGGYPDYFAEYTTSLNRLREDLYANRTTDRFQPVRARLDSVITLSLQFNAERKSLMGDLFDYSGSIQDYNRHMKAVDRYSTYRYRMDALNDAEKALNEQLSAAANAQEKFGAVRALRRDLLRLARETNAAATQLEFLDTLAYAPVVENEDDVLKTVYAAISDPGEFDPYENDSEPAMNDSLAVDSLVVEQPVSNGRSDT